MSKYVVIKCRKCRTKLLDSLHSEIVTGHEIKIDENTFPHTNSEVGCKNFIDSLYLEEIGLPIWILDSINLSDDRVGNETPVVCTDSLAASKSSSSEADWQKGKLKCPKCEARLGSFDYLSGRKCQCEKSVLPPVHIIKSKIDSFWEQTSTV